MVSIINHFKCSGNHARDTMLYDQNVTNLETHWRVNLWRLCKFHYFIIVCRGNVFKLFSMYSQVRQHWVDLSIPLVLYNWWQECVSCSLYIRHGDASNAWLMFIERCSWNWPSIQFARLIWMIESHQWNWNLKWARMASLDQTPNAINQSALPWRKRKSRQCDHFFDTQQLSKLFFSSLKFLPRYNPFRSCNGMTLPVT